MLYPLGTVYDSLEKKKIYRELNLATRKRKTPLRWLCITKKM